MNTANLQLEGLLVALSQLFEALRRKGVLTQQEIESALADAEAAIDRDSADRDISAAEANGIRFPIRFLRVATNLAEGPAPSFRELAVLVGESNDIGK